MGFELNNGTYNEIIGSSTNFGTLTAGPVFSLGGTLEITLQNGFIPTIGQKFAMDGTNGIAGTFANIEGQTFTTEPKCGKSFTHQAK